jgi:integrase
VIARRRALPFVGLMLTALSTALAESETAPVLDAGGLTAREIADQLGHARPSITMDRYTGRGVAFNGAATVLEALA